MRYESIMLIDDDEDDRDIFEMAIKTVRANVNYTAFSSAIEALKILKDNIQNPDIIFLDLNMPIMNGQDFLREIKRTDSLKEIPVIIFSTSSSFANISQTRQLGAHDYITKPYTFDRLVKILESIV